MKLINDNQKNYVTPAEMQDGQVGIIRQWGTHESYANRLVQAFEGRIICLGKSTGNSWSRETVASLNTSAYQIEVFQPGTQITVEI